MTTMMSEDETTQLLSPKKELRQSCLTFTAQICIFWQTTRAMQLTFLPEPTDLMPHCTFCNCESFVPYDEGRRLLKRLSQLSGKRRTAYMCHNANRHGRGGTHQWASFGKKQRPSQLPCLACVCKRASYCLDSILYKNDGALGGAIRFAACFGIVNFLHNSG